MSSTTQAPVRHTTYPLRYDRVFSCAPGVLVPVHTFATLPGDSHTLSISCAIDTLTVDSPAYARYRAQYRLFWTDFRAYIPQIDQDIVALNPEAVTLPLAPPPYFKTSSSSGTVVSLTEFEKNCVAATSLVNCLYYPVGSGIGFTNNSTNDNISAKITAVQDGLPSLLPALAYVHTYYKY